LGDSLALLFIAGGVVEELVEFLKLVGKYGLHLYGLLERLPTVRAGRGHNYEVYLLVNDDILKCFVVGII
jgi:hypothetical protein